MRLEADRFYYLIDVIRSTPLMFLNALISYFGHYGVQLFIFVSGYGLAKQYSKNSDVSYFRFVIPRLTKIYFLLIFGLILYIVFFFRPLNLHNVLSVASSSLLMYNNLSYDRIFRFVGPWWFFSLIMQLYVLFPLIYKGICLGKNKERSFLVMLLVSYLLIYLLFPVTEKLNIPLFGNSIGHLPEFMFGICLAVSDRFRLNLKIILLSLIVFILSNINGLFFPLSFLSVTILLLALLHPLYTSLNSKIIPVFSFLGELSMFMFVINGPLRALTIPLFIGANPIYILFGSILHLVLVVMVSYLMRLVYVRTMQPLSNQFIKLILKKN